MTTPAPRKPGRGKRTPDAAQKADGEGGPGDRLQKVLAAAGVASRRECEQFILEGRVEVDRKTVTQLGTRVDPQRQEIRVDGVELPRPKLQYYMINKPPGVVTTSRDPWARTRVIDLAPERAGRLFPVGRLDMASEGLVLLTNDGELANRLAHPRYGVEKTYSVQVAGDVGQEVLQSLKRGVWIAEGRVRPERVHVARSYKKSTILNVVLREGKNREIRRILAALGHKVQRLRRMAIGTLRLGDLPLGQARALSHEELRQLQETSLRPPKPESEGAADAPGDRPARGPQHSQGRRRPPRPPWKPKRPGKAGPKQPGGRPATGRQAGGRQRPARPSESGSRPPGGAKPHGRRRPR